MTAAQRLLAAVETLLERRSDGMVTAEEWQALQAACAALRAEPGFAAPPPSPEPRPPGCEFCRQEYNRPLDPYRCPYCQAAWPARPRRKR